MLRHFAITMILLSTSNQVYAQPQDTKVSFTTEKEPSHNEIKQELDELKSIIAEQQKYMQNQDERLESLETEMLEIVTNQLTKDEQNLDIYGFFDVLFHYPFHDDDYPLKGWTPHQPTFAIQNFNLFLRKNFTTELQAVAEIHFSFQPTGETEFGLPFPDKEYSHQDIHVTDPYSHNWKNLGGIGIERLYLSYTPFQQFGIKTGRFLTPYGIWNEEHSSLLLITVFQPMTQTLQLIPTAQTGIQFFGRFFPRKYLTFDYALLLTNGKGPLESIIDLDENKAVGMKLKRNYSAKKVI